MKETRSTCCYCGVGCGVLIESDGSRVTGVRGDPDHPANFGRLCTKGAALNLSTSESARLLYPELRASRNEERTRVGWEEALACAAERFARCIERHGPDSVAFYISGQLLTEDYYVFNKLAKGLIGTNNVDTNSRLCMSSAVAGYKLSLGADAPPCCYEDLDHAETIFIAGSNTAFAHPVLFRRIEDARARNPALKVIVVDPRVTETARAADLHLALRPGTDVMLFNAMLHVMERDGLLDRRYIEAHTEGFDALRARIAPCTPDLAAAVCEVPAPAIVRAAHLFARARSTLSLYCQGLNQSTSGTYKNCALINLHLATGHIGRPGAGPFSLTGQPNAMGGREVGGMANLLSAHRDLGNAQHRAEMARFWGVPEVPARPGRTAVELFRAIERREIRMVWIACTNPAQSMPDADSVRAALDQAEFVVVQDVFRDTDTCEHADLLLPATGWAEKTGTVTNSERRISRVRPALSAPGEARHDWQIAVDFARRLGERLKRPMAEALFPYGDPEEIFNEHRATTAGRDLDISGMSYESLEQQGPQQWPLKDGEQVGRARLYADGVYPTPTGRARFVVTDYVTPAEEPDADYPLRLTSGRLRDQWHSMSRTGLVPRLFSHSPEPEIVLNPGDVRAALLAEGGFARVSTRRGSVVLKVRSSDDMRSGDAFVAMHWGRRYASHAGANALTVSACDPWSEQPELKHAAAQVTRFEPGWRSVLLRTVDTPEAAVTLHRALAPLLARFTYGAFALAEDARRVVSVELAATTAPPSEDLASFDRLFGLAQQGELLVHRDTARGIDRRALLEGNAVMALRLTGDLTGAARLSQAMLAGVDVAPLRALLLAPVAGLPGLPQARGRTVCSCLQVGEEALRRSLAGGMTLPELQVSLRCGTQCGSCVPELRRMIAEHAAPVAAASLLPALAA